MSKKIIFCVSILTLLLSGHSGSLGWAGFQPDNIRIDTDSANHASSYPKIASDNNGHVYAAWKDDRPGSQGVFFNRSNDYGATWLTQDVSIRTTAQAETLKIGCDQSGHIYVTWREGTSVILARSADFGQSWSSSGIAGPVSEGFDFAYSQNGHLVVVWNTNNNFDLHANRSLDYGATWLPQPVSVITQGHYPGDDHLSPSISIDNGGDVYVVWVDERGGTSLEKFVYFNRSLDSGQTWATEFSISPTNNGYVAKAPQIVCDNSGHAYAVWKRQGYPSESNYYLQFNNSLNYGQSWVGVPYFPEMYVDNPRLACDDSGNVYLAWNNIQYPPWYKVYSKSSFDYGVTWHSAVQVNNAHNCQQGNFDMAVKGRNVYVVWENNEPWQGIFFNFSKDGGISWQTRDGRVDSNPGEEGVVTNRPAISVDTNENIFVLWEDGRNGANTDIYFNQGSYILSLNEKIKLEADYILTCQFLSPGHPAHGAINDVYTPDVPPDYVVPRENGMAILGLLLASQTLNDSSYRERAEISMDYLVRTQESDGSWRDEYDYRTPPGSLSKSPTQPAEVMMAMYMLGYRDDRYQSMKRGAQYLLECQDHGYQGLIAGGKDPSGIFYTWNWITDNSYAYWALRAAYGWALVQNDTVFAQECLQTAEEILSGINNYFYKNPDWWTVVDQNGIKFYHDFGVNGRISWMNVAPQFLDLPADGVGSVAVGDWIHDHFQQQNGGCIWGDAFPNQEYPGISFQSSLCWLDLDQDSRANEAIAWAENSSLWQLVPDEHGILGGWVDWVNINDPSQRAGAWERYVDTSFYSIASWLGGYNFTVFNNLPPVLLPIGNKSVYVNELLTFQISATDPEGANLRYQATNFPSDATFDPDTRTFRWVPTATGNFVVHFEVSDGYLIDSENVTITVRRRGGTGCFLAGTSILMADGNSLPIEKIKVGDKVLSADKDGNMAPKKVTKLYVHPETKGYFIIETKKGKTLRVTGDHRVFSDGSYRPVHELAVGSLLTILKDGKLVETPIISIKPVNETPTVYNLEVKDIHTYFAEGYLVHNLKMMFSVYEPPEFP